MPRSSHPDTSSTSPADEPKGFPRTVRRRQPRSFGEHPDGGISDIVWWQGNDCHGLDTWESEAAFAQFGETRLGPAMVELGIDARVNPTFHAPYEIFVPEAVTITAT